MYMCVCIGTTLSAGIGAEPSSAFKDYDSSLGVSCVCFALRGLISYNRYALEIFDDNMTSSE